ncbi:MAG TPA: amidohydrolase family protein, partial [Wenzhouxiangella sp.]|nr:amidohydrolase family protein [Wenzhouxiangella sp.]
MKTLSAVAAPWRRLLAGGMILLLGATTALAQPADTVYRNGSIITMAGEAPEYAQVLAVKGGKIAFVGPEDAAATWIGPSTQLVDLDGKTLLPGFLDSHSHYINALLVAQQCKLYAPPAGPGKDVPSIIAELKSCAEEREIAEGELLIGYGYDDTVMPDGRLLNRDDLDEAFPNNPVRVDHVSMHGA